MTRLMPNRSVPDLRIDTLAGRTWSLSDQLPQHFTMIIFYRGLHCPLCAVQLKEIHTSISEFETLGVGVIAISSDDEDRARQAKTAWGLDTFEIGFGLSLKDASDWGLYLSSPRGEEPANFSEPGLFLVRPDRTLYASIVQTMPFTRPSTKDLLRTLEFVIMKDYPGRGELALQDLD